MNIYVRPADGRRCPMASTTPDGRVQWLPAEGKRVEASTYWRRRIKDGAAVIAPEPPQETDDKAEV